MLLLLLTEKDPAVPEKRNGNNEQINPENRCWHVASYQIEHFLHCVTRKLRPERPAILHKNKISKKRTAGGINDRWRDSRRWPDQAVWRLLWLKAVWSFTPGLCWPLGISPQLAFALNEGWNAEFFLVDQKGSFSFSVDLKSPGFLTMEKGKN